jgi:CRISPR/Cas system-associated protein Cas7 (RAMP superfamily)
MGRCRQMGSNLQKGDIMKMPIADVADKCTILLIKILHGLDVSIRELGVYLEECKENNINIDCLHIINRNIWMIEEDITKETKLEKIGKLYLELRTLNMLRVNEKNKIAKEHSEPMELKKY